MSLIISDEILQAVQMSEAELLTEIATMLFQKEKFTLEQASRFANMNQLQFQQVLASRQIPLHHNTTKIEENIPSINPAFSRENRPLPTCVGMGSSGRTDLSERDEELLWQEG